MHELLLEPVAFEGRQWMTCQTFHVKHTPTPILASTAKKILMSAEYKMLAKQGHMHRLWHKDPRTVGCPLFKALFKATANNPLLLIDKTAEVALCEVLSPNSAAMSRIADAPGAARSAVHLRAACTQADL